MHGGCKKKGKGNVMVELDTSTIKLRKWAADKTNNSDDDDNEDGEDTHHGDDNENDDPENNGYKVVEQPGQATYISGFTAKYHGGITNIHPDQHCRVTHDGVRAWGGRGGLAGVTDGVHGCTSSDAVLVDIETVLHQGIPVFWL